MASPLALLIQSAKKPSPACKHAAEKNHHEHLANALKDAFTAAPDPKTDIIHYAWVNILPPAVTGGQVWLLVSVAYDLAFGPYIQNLLRAQHATWDGIFACVEGAQGFVPVLEHLDAATKWVCSVDLNHGQTFPPVAAPAFCANTNGGAVVGFTQAYQDTVIDIVTKK